MSYYSVLEVTPTDDSWIPGYLLVAKQLVKKQGGVYIASSTSEEWVDGEGENTDLRFIEWPSRDTALAFIADPEYVPHLEARKKGSVSKHVLIEGKDDLG